MPIKPRQAPSPHWSGFDLRGRALGQPEAMGYARACWPSGRETDVEMLAIQIATMTALDDAFESARARIAPSMLWDLMPWRHRPERRLGAEWEGMRGALGELDLRLRQIAHGTASRRAAVHAWWRRMAEQQVAAFACEAAWRLDGTLPDLTSYLQVGQRSIGVEWTAASLIALDLQANVPRPGSALANAIEAIARAIRLANDLHDPERERREGKVQWLLLRARELAGCGYEVHSAERMAALELRSAAAAEVARARVILRDANAIGGTPALRAGLEGLLRVGLVTYVPELAEAA